MERESPHNFEDQQSAIRRIVGLSENDEKEILGKARELFAQQELIPFEREKTERELHIINDVLYQLPKFLVEYGIESLQLTSNHIHIVDETSLTPGQKNTHGILDETGGYYMEDRQGVVAFSSSDDLIFAERVAHEAIHANSFSSFTREKSGYKLRRMGLTILDNEGRRYFHNLNEGLTEELVKRFDKKYSEEIPSLSKAVARRKELIASIKSRNPKANTDEIKSVITEQEPDGQWKTTISEYVYSKERREFSKLTQDLYEKNRDRFTSLEDVSRLFIQAAFTGRLLEIGKLIEDTLGEGSLRKFGEKTEWKKKEVLVKSHVKKFKS